MPAQKTQRRKHKLSKLETTCQQYGVDCYYDEFCLCIEFNDGKKLFYALPYSSERAKNRQLDDYVLDMICVEGCHGRAYSKDHKFLGYAPKCNSLDEILVAVDLMS